MGHKSWFCPVPWFNADEWRKVKEQIYGPEANEASKNEALHTLLTWRLRTIELPAAVDSTLSLLEATLNHDESERIRRLLHSAAIIRFVNLMLDESQSGVTLLHAASLKRVPRWVVQLRHEATHGRDLPSLASLRRGAETALRWLEGAYWNPQSETLVDFRTGDCAFSARTFKFNREVGRLVSVYGIVSVLTSKNFKIATFGQITDAGIRKELTRDLVKIDPTKFTKAISDELSLEEVRSHALKMIERRLNKSPMESERRIVVDLLTDEESLFLCPDAFSPEDEASNPMDADAWRDLLTLFHDRELMTPLLDRLIAMTRDESLPVKRRRAAALRVKHVCSGLEKTALVSRSLLDYGKDPSKRITKEKYVANFLKKHPKFDATTAFDARRRIPEEVCDVAFLRRAAASRHPFLKYYVKNLMNLVDPPLSKAIRRKLVRLMGIFDPECASSGESANREDFGDRVRSLEDLKAAMPHRIERATEEIASDDTNPWKRSSDAYEWGKFPLGILPWQAGAPKFSL